MNCRGATASLVANAWFVARCAPLDRPAAVARYPAADRSARPYRPLPRPARHRQLAVSGHWYDFRWALIGNLGIDLLIVPFAPLFGLELAVKLIVIAIPALTVAGLLWIAREVHGRIPPTALFALPLAYSYPFQFGFVNFALSMALALCLFALWLRLGRLGQFGLRAAVFVPVSCLSVGVPHLRLGGAGRARLLGGDDPPARLRARAGAGIGSRRWFRAGLGCLPLALPIG